jgi:hypothetical protein
LSVTLLTPRKTDDCYLQKESGDQIAVAYQSHLPILYERRTLKIIMALLKNNVNTIEYNLH